MDRWEERKRRKKRRKGGKDSGTKREEEEKGREGEGKEEEISRWEDRWIGVWMRRWAMDRWK